MAIPRVLSRAICILIGILVPIPISPGLTGVQEGWGSIQQNPSFYREVPLDYIWVVNTVDPNHTEQAFPPDLFNRYGNITIGSFQRLVHASPQYIHWLSERYGVDERQRFDDGSANEPFAPANYFVVPTEHRVEWHWLLSRNALELGASQVCYEEPEFWKGTGYSSIMKEKYRQLYGEDVAWKDDSCTFRQRFRMEKLKEEVLGEAYVELFDKIKSHYPNVTTIIPMHDIASYQIAKITSPFAQNLKNRNADVIQSQTWDWALEWASDERIAAYFDLAYWVFSSKFRPDLQLWLLTDPVNDPLQVNMQNVRDYRAAVDAGILLGYYTHHIPWPMSRLSAIRKKGWLGYEKEVYQNFWIHNSHYQFSSSRLDRSSYPKLGLLYAEERNYVTYDGEFRAGRDPLRDVTRPLLEQMLKHGEKVQIIETGLIDQPHMLDDLSVIVADGEAGGFVTKKSCADSLLSWIRSGGTLLWLGSPGNFGGIPDYASSPLHYLASKMGVTLGKLKSIHPGALPIRLVRESGNTTLDGPVRLVEPFVVEDVENAKVLYRMPTGEIFAWSKPWGKGQLVYFGYPGSEARYGETSHWRIIKQLLADKGVDVPEDGLIRFERTVDNNSRYEIIWPPPTSTASNATIWTYSWRGHGSTSFAIPVSPNRNMVVLKTPYLSVASEQVVPVNISYGGDSATVLLESLGRSSPLDHPSPNDTVYLFLPDPWRVRSVKVAGQQTYEPERLLKIDLTGYRNKIVIQFWSTLPPATAGQIPEATGTLVSLTTLLVALLGAVSRHGRLHKKLHHHVQPSSKLESDLPQKADPHEPKLPM